MMMAVTGDTRLIIINDLPAGAETTATRAERLAELSGSAVTIHVCTPQALIEAGELPPRRPKPQFTARGEQKRRPWKGK